MIGYSIEFYLESLASCGNYVYQHKVRAMKQQPQLTAFRNAITCHSKQVNYEFMITDTVMNNADSCSFSMKNTCNLNIWLHMPSPITNQNGVQTPCSHSLLLRSGHLDLYIIERCAPCAKEAVCLWPLGRLGVSLGVPTRGARARRTRADEARACANRADPVRPRVWRAGPSVSSRARF